MSEAVSVCLIAVIGVLLVAGNAAGGDRGRRNSNSRYGNNRDSRSYSRTVSLKSGTTRRLGENADHKPADLQTLHEQAKAGAFGTSAPKENASAAREGNVRLEGDARVSGGEQAPRAVETAAPAMLPPALREALAKRILEEEQERLRAAGSTNKSTMIILPVEDEDPFAKKK